MPMVDRVVIPGGGRYVWPDDSSATYKMSPAEWQLRTEYLHPTYIKRQCYLQSRQTYPEHSTLMIKTRAEGDGRPKLEPDNNNCSSSQATIERAESEVREWMEEVKAEYDQGALGPGHGRRSTSEEGGHPRAHPANLGPNELREHGHSAKRRSAIANPPKRGKKRALQLKHRMNLRKRHKDVAASSSQTTIKTCQGERISIDIQYLKDVRIEDGELIFSAKVDLMLEDIHGAENRRAAKRLLTQRLGKEVGALIDV